MPIPRNTQLFLHFLCFSGFIHSTQSVNFIWQRIKHRKNCEICPTQVTWKSMLECQLCLSCLSLKTFNLNRDIPEIPSPFWVYIYSSISVITCFLIRSFFYDLLSLVLVLSTLFKGVAALSLHSYLHLVVFHYCYMAT